MCTFGNDGREPTSIDNYPDTDFRCNETQPFDSQFSSSFLPGDDGNYGDDYDSSHFNTMPFDYEYCAEDDTGTEVVNLFCETQVMDLAGETQAIDLAGETQAWDDFDSRESSDTQLLDHDGERTNITEIIASPNELSDGDSRRGCDQVMAGKNPQLESGYEKKSTSSSLVAPRFTSIRTEFLRQAALTRRMVGNRIDSETCTTMNASHSSDQQALRNNGITFSGDSNEAKIAPEKQERSNEIKCRNSTARKLCFESLSGNKESFPISKDNDLEELHKFPVTCSEVAGLSYVDSEEPGDLSQANALDFVERFLQDNVAEFDVAVDSGKNMLGESKLTPASRGLRDLAKRASNRREVASMGVFDWDDNREDEGGGDIFVRRKEEFFGSDNSRRVSLSFPRRTKTARSNKFRDEPQENAAKKNNLLLSDSKVALHNLKGNGLTIEAGSMKMKRNLLSELDQLDGINPSIQLEGVVAVKNTQDLLNVGPDTQIAAEAMEALFNGEGMVNNGTDYSEQVPGKNLEDCPKSCSAGKAKNSVGSRHLCSKRNLSSRGIKRGDKVNPDNILERNAMASKRNPTKKQRLTHEFSEADKTELGELVQSDPKESAMSNQDRTGSSISLRRSQRICLGNVREPRKLYDSSPQSLGFEDVGRSASTRKRKWTGIRSTCLGLRKSSKLQSSVHEYIKNDNFCDAAEKDRNLRFNAESHAECLLSAGNSKLITQSNKKQGERYESSDLASASTGNCKTPSNDASPVCMGNDYNKQSCKRNLGRSALLKELRSLTAASEPLTPTKDSRKRQDMTDVHVLFSHHLDDDVIKHQKKILARLGSSIAFSIADATHFVADQFVRTRNMLEAIASGKPVVTHLWIESCGQASCFIDERNYILRDEKKEKELGYCMPVSLARAGKHPLLKGRQVLITPNTKPSKETISSLVKAVQGQAVERISRSSFKDGKIPDDLLVLSCDEDFDTCVPFLRKGVAVYSSELLLNGIVTQKLEYERHLLFADDVKRTRSTIWLREDGQTFQPVTKCK